MLLGQAERLSGLSQTVAKVLRTGRENSKVQHSIFSMLRQRIDGLALGFDDSNDQEGLRGDLAFQTVG